MTSLTPHGMQNLSTYFSTADFITPNPLRHGLMTYWQKSFGVILG